MRITVRIITSREEVAHHRHKFHPSARWRWRYVVPARSIAPFDRAAGVEAEKHRGDFHLYRQFRLVQQRNRPDEDSEWR